MALELNGPRTGYDVLGDYAQVACNNDENDGASIRMPASLAGQKGILWLRVFKNGVELKEIQLPLAKATPGQELVRITQETGVPSEEVVTDTATFYHRRSGFDQSYDFELQHHGGLQNDFQPVVRNSLNNDAVMFSVVGGATSVWSGQILFKSDF